MLSASKKSELEIKLRNAEAKIAYLERISKLEIEVKESQAEKISRLELKLKESLRANADCTTRLCGLERQLQQTEQSKRKFETSFNSMQAKFAVTSSELDNAKLKLATSAIDADSRLEMITALHMLCEKNDRIMVRYEGSLDITGWHTATEFKFRFGKTYSDFISFWEARRVQSKFDHLLKLDFREGVLEYMIHDANEEVSELKEEHRLMATRVESMYLRMVLWSVRKAKLAAIPWNYATNKKATKVEILDFILEVITSKYKRVKRRW